jgi:hypothetical protein
MSHVLATLTIAARYCGPPDSGNGGYVSGLLAEQLGQPLEVTLRAPPPLGQPLRLEADGGGGGRLLHGERVLAEARVAALELEVPEAPSFAQAEEATRHHVTFTDRPFRQCFTCGPDRAVGDGLRILPGRLGDDPRAIAPFVPHPAQAGADGNLPLAVAWAALDCSGYFAAVAHAHYALLGRMCAHVPVPLSAQERYVAVGWPLGREGRKLFAGTAIFDERGVLRGKARQTWIALE